MAKENKFEKQLTIKNKKASYEYHFIETYVAGISLTGTEIKSIRMNNASIGEAYCVFKETSLFLKNAHISKYNEGTYNNHEPLRDRALLLKKKELRKIFDLALDKGNTIIPLKLFINDRGLAKLEIAVAKGKKLFDKRDDIKAKDIKREMDRDLK